MDITVTGIEFVLHRQPNPSWRIESLANPKSHIIACAVGGKAEYAFAGKSRTVSRGDVIFFPKGMVHSAHSSPESPFSYYSVAFDADFFSPDDCAWFESLPNQRKVSNFIELRQAFAKLDQTWSGMDFGYMLRCRGILLEILYLFFRESQNVRQTPHIKAIEDVIEAMALNYYKSYTVEELARLARLSQSHFRVLFKRVTGTSVIRYLNNIRINKARDLISSGDCNVTDAAVSTGFNDVFYFSRMFKRVTGHSPSEYIRK